MSLPTIKSRKNKDPKKSQATDTKPRLDNRYIPLLQRQNEVLRHRVRCQAYTDNYEDLDEKVGVDAEGQPLELIRHRTLHDKFVLKKLPDVDKSRREASLQYLAGLTQENCSILKLIEIYYNKDENKKKCFYLILEYAEGGSLFDKISCHVKNRRADHAVRFSMAQVSRHTFKIARILLFLHEIMGVAHRDLKPENILFNKQGELILADFGFAKQFQLLNKHGKMEPYKELNTKSGWSLNTVAPEFFNSFYDERVDFWSLGVCCYCMIALSYPFDTLNQATFNKTNVINEIKKGEVNYGAKIWERNPDALNFVKKLLKKDPQQRMTLNELFDHPFINQHNSKIEHPATEFKDDQKSQAIDLAYDHAYKVEPLTFNNGAYTTVNRTKRKPTIFTRYSNKFRYIETANSTSEFNLSDYDESKCEQFLNLDDFNRKLVLNHMDEQRSPDTGGDFPMNNFNMNNDALAYSTNNASNSKIPRLVQQHQPMQINRNIIRGNESPVKDSGTSKQI